ncbi:MAG: membrane-bound lytic murein transglycosylase MltF [Gammaproteobacteria bacterium]|nr:membrane-bound lytic murein transglycosylase MltF [Gammaproteobacteria bacterium]
MDPARVAAVKISRLRRSALWLVLPTSAIALSTCSPRPSLLQRVQRAGVLKVAAINSPTVCYRGPFGEAGYECDLLAGLARKLKVRLDYRFVRNAAAAVDAVREGRAQLGAAGLNVLSRPQPGVRFAPPFLEVIQELAFRRGAPAPASLGDLQGTLVVVAGSEAAARLRELAAKYPQLRFRTTDDLSREDLLYQVAHGEIDYTVITSDLLAINQRYYPQLDSAFAIAAPERIGWALRDGPDSSLLHAVTDYLNSVSAQEMRRLRETYLEDNLDYLGVTRLAHDIQTRLPRYREQFEQAGRKYGVDWRLLAAIGYQESHWDPGAVSPTGVRGLMMLTTDTASLLDVADRTNPTQSIDGAGRYFTSLLQTLATVPQPDRTWLALAAYNMGFGHLQDAQSLVRSRGGNPDRWADVKQVLPLLTRQQVYRHLRLGYARGREAELYVTNVRSYYDVLTWTFRSHGGVGLALSADS